VTEIVTLTNDFIDEVLPLTSIKRNYSTAWSSSCVALGLFLKVINFPPCCSIFGLDKIKMQRDFKYRKFFLKFSFDRIT
jgi:hypothetical protein